MRKWNLISIQSLRGIKDGPFQCFACGKKIPNGGATCLECDPNDSRFLIKSCLMKSATSRIYPIGEYGNIVKDKTNRLLKENSFGKNT